jgi:hypothetical protein
VLIASELVSLSEVVAAAPDDQEPAPGFRAQLAGVEYVVTAVLERTAVLELPGDRWADKEMARLDQLLVDPAAITWQSKPPRPGRASWRGRRRPTADPQAQRTATDEQARADQARLTAAQPSPPHPRPRPTAAPAQGETVGGKRPASRGAGGRPPQVATMTAAAVRAAPRASSTAVLLPASSSVPSPSSSPASRSTSARLPATVREVADRLLWALDRIDELEAERERSQAAQRRLIRRARAAMQRKAS